VTTSARIMTAVTTAAYPNGRWKKPSMAFFHSGAPKKAEVFRGCQSPRPAAGDFFHGLPGVARDGADSGQELADTARKWYPATIACGPSRLP